MRRPTTVTAPAKLLEYLFATWPDVKKKQVRTWLKFHAVTVNGRAITQFDHPLHPGDEVAIRTDRFAVPTSTLGSGMKVYAEDTHVIVVDKPSGLLSIASVAESEKTAYAQLTAYVRQVNKRTDERIWIVHRLDRETSGLMVFAKSPQAKQALQSGWDKALKRYEAVVEGRLPGDKGMFTSELDETNPYRVVSAPPSDQTRRAVTYYRVIKRGRSRTLVELTLETGRRHQIRVQLNDAGCPIVGDAKYGARSDPAKRLALHACLLEFPHPEDGRTMHYESPLPKELARLV